VHELDCITSVWQHARCDIKDSKVMSISLNGKIYIIMLSRKKIVFWRMEGNLMLDMNKKFDIFLAEFIVLSG